MKHRLSTVAICLVALASLAILVNQTSQFLVSFRSKPAEPERVINVRRVDVPVITTHSYTDINK